MAQMLNSTVVPALALAASLAELASLVDCVIDVDYMSRSPETETGTDADGASLGAHVASCLRHVSVALSAALARPPVPMPALEHSRQRGLSALRAAVRDLDTLATWAMSRPLKLD